MLTVDNLRKNGSSLSLADVAARIKNIHAATNDTRDFVKSSRLET